MFSFGSTFQEVFTNHLHTAYSCHWN